MKTLSITVMAADMMTIRKIWTVVLVMTSMSPSFSHPVSITVRQQANAANRSNIVQIAPFFILHVTIASAIFPMPALPVASVGWFVNGYWLMNACQILAGVKPILQKCQTKPTFLYEVKSSKLLW